MTTLTLNSDRIVNAATAQPWASVTDLNLSIASSHATNHSQWCPPATMTRLVAWSGWLADPLATHHWPRDPRSWTTDSRATLDAALDRLLAIAPFTTGTSLLLRPHARHLLSDIPRCLNLLRSRANQPLGLVLDPAAMLEPSMLNHAEDHCRRILEALADHPAVAGVVVTNIRRSAVAGDEALIPSPLCAGELPPTLLLSLARELAPSLPLIVLPGDEPQATNPR